MRGGSVPAHVWLVLGVAICGVSSAGAIFTHVDEIDPLLRASWRLQLTALILAPLAVWQLYQVDDEGNQNSGAHPQRKSSLLVAFS